MNGKKLEESATQWIKNHTFTIPQDLMEHPIFVNSAGIIYCATKEGAEDFFRRIRIDLNRIKDEERRRK